MFLFVIVPLMTVAGYAALPPWVVLLGIGGMAEEGWWAKVHELWRHPRTGWSTKIRAYFVTGLVANVAVAATAYAIGRALRAVLG